MPIYRIQSPSGKIYRIEGPQDADPNVLFQLAQQQEEAEQIQQLRLDYGPGVLGTLGQATKRGFQQLGSTITDIIPALGASALGFDEYAREQMAEAQEKARAREMEAPTLFPSYKNVRGIGDVPKFVAETIGENVANIGAALVPGVGAAGLAARAGVGAAGRLAATNAGTFLGSYALNAPEIFQNIYENTGELSPSAALIAGSVSAALDSILPAQLAKKLTSQAKAGIVEKVLERSGMDRGLARSVTASVISGIPTEGLTEGAQEAISIAAERFIDKNPDVFGSNEWERITNSAIKGAIAGGAFGGVGGGIEAARTGAERRAAYEDALQRRQERLQERDIAKLGQEIESLQTIDGQMQLPGFELGPATTLYTPPPKEKKLTKEERAAQKAQADADAIAAREAGIPPPITGKQLEMFTATGELTPPMQRAADKQEQILARQAKQKEEAANKEAQARLKRLLSATQLELPGFDQASLKAYQEAETAAAASPQYDLFRPAPTGTTTGQPPAPPTLETITKLDDLIGFGKLLGIGRTARILRPDSPLAGKDISDPAQAAEVKKVLEAYASGKPAAGASANIESFLRRPEFQGVSDVAKPDQQTGGEGAGMVSQPSIQPATGPLGQAEPSRVVSTEPATGEAPIGEATQPAALATPKAPTDRQQRIEFGKALGATYGESLRYRQNQQAANAVVNQDFKGVLAALQKSKNPIIQEVARRAGTLNTKIKLEEGAFESVEDESTIMRQLSIDAAKMHLNALDYIRDIAPQIEKLPDGAALPYETVAGYPLQVFEKGEPTSKFGLKTVVNNKHSMFSPLNLPTDAKLNTKEDFLKLRDAMEAATTKLGESNIRMTASASPYRQTIAGAYDAATDTIKIAEDAEGGTYYAKNENLLTHEIVHAQASNAVANPTKEQKPIVERLNNLYQHVKQHYKKVQEQEDSEYYRPPYGVASIQEFLAEGIGNTNFQYDLSRIKYQNTNAWDKFVEYIANLLGLKNDNALTELLTIYAELTNQGDIQQELIEAAKPSQAKTEPAPRLKQKPTETKKETPSAVTPTETKQAKEEGAAAPAEGTEVAGAPAKPTELRAIIKKKIDDQIANMLRANYISEGKELLLKNLPDLDFRGQSYFNLFRIPRLVQNINDKRRFIAKIKDAKKPTNQDKANQEDLTALLNEINKYDPATQKFINRLLDANPALQEKIFGLINNLARKQYTEQIDSVIKVLRQAQQDIRDKTESERRQENINIAQANLADKEARERRLEEEVDLRRAMEALVSGVAKKVKNPLWQEFAESVKNPKKPGKKLPLLSSLYSGPAFNPAQMDMAKQGNINGLLSSIIRQTKDPAIRQVLVRLRGLNLKTKLEVSSPGELVEQTMMAGMYDPDTNTITLDAANGLNAHAFVHELIHAAISNVLSNPSHPLTKEFNKFFDQIQNRLGAAYGAQNLQEFAAELVGNPQFQAILKDIKTPRSESLFKRIMRSIAEFLGFAPKTSAFETGLNFINNAIDITNNVEASAGQKMFLGMGNFPAVGTTGNSMPSPTAAALQNAKNVLSDLGDSGLRTAAFGLLRLDNINQMYKKELPALQNLLDAVEKRSGAQERFIKGINDKYKSFVAVQKKLPQQMKTLNDIAIDARIAEVDILDPNFVPSAKQVSEFNRLKQAFRSLDASVQDVYRTVRADYDASFNRYMKVIKDAADKVSPSLAAKLAQEFQTRKPLIGYVPFQRYGDFYVEYTDPSNNERTVSGFESRSERQAFIDTMLKNIPHKSYQKLEDVRFTGEGVPQSSFIFKIMDGLRKQNASQDQLNAVYQAYLATFPGESLMRQFMKSKNVRGMERDLVRNYGDLMIRWARKLTNAEYVPQIDRALYELKEQGKVTSDPNAEAAVRNILEQAPFLHNPTFNNFVHTATQLSYFEYIAGNISSAIINLSSVPMMAWPMLVGKFGWGKATETMLAAGRTAVNDWGKNPKYKNLYDTLNDHAQLEHTMAREILEGRRQSTGDYLGLKARVLDGLSIPFIAAEKFNRGITAIAAFDLAKASGMSEKEAIRYALDTVKDVHTSGMAATGPRWTQAPLGRIFFTFKSFVWNSAYVMARAFHQSFKGETKEIQHAARRQLLSTYGMATVLTGVKGMPFYGAVSTLATMLNALFGDDDEPFNFDEFMRDAFGEMFFKGFANEFLNLEVASRAGIATDLLFRDDPRGVAEHGYVLSAMQQAFGPLGSIAVNTGRAVEMFKDGHIERGLETALPSFVRNFMKGTRYMIEGATTLDGNPVMGDISAYNSLMQMIGFAPADLSTRYEKIQAGKSFERDVLKRRGQLLDLYDMANTSGDTELLEKTMEDIQRFNETIPEKAITKQVLDRSAAQRRAAEQQMIYGVRFDPKLRQRLIDEILEDED